MDSSAEIKAHHLGSLVLASLGWVAAAGVVLWFFLVAKPSYYQQGVEQGIAAQQATDKAKYESAFGQPVNAQPEAGLVNVRVISVKPGSVLVEDISFGAQGPFVSSPKQRTVILTDQTTIVRRVVIGPDELQRRQKAAEAKGENALLIAPFDDFPTTAADIKPGLRLEVIAQDPRAMDSSSFAAQFVAVVDEASIPQVTPQN